MRAKPREKLSQKERIKEITDQLEAGVQAVFESVICIDSNRFSKNL